jgi:NADPH:quinone reductase-like Zn-dependent oxidoreductase
VAADADTVTIGRDGPSRRTFVVVVTLATLLAVGAAVVDARVRAAENRAVEACADHAVAAARESWSPVLAMSGYVRPVLDASGSGSLRRAMYALVRRAAEDADAPLTTAAAACRRVDLFPLHGELRRRRDGCVRALDAQRRFLDRVARNGAAIAEEWPATLTGC